MAGAWVDAPLLPWQVQCPVRVCVALAAGLRSWGRCRVLCLSRSSPPALRSPRCVWRVVPSACPFPSPACTPIHAVCAFRGLGPVALLEFFGCPLRVCALALSRRPRPSLPLWSVWRAHLAWFRCRAHLGPFHAVRAPPRFLRRSRAPSGLLWGGGRPGPVPPMPGSGSCADLRPGLCIRGGPAPGGGGGCGQVACFRTPPGGVAGGPRGAGGRSTLVRPSAFPRRAPKRVSWALLSLWRAWPPYCSGLCLRVDPGCRPRGALVCWRGSACLSWSLWEQAGGGVGACGARA